MMTIKEFASLCQCNTQTLRYYDKIDLLKPSKVDPWSGYRYYEEAQALDFVKIKNLQAADFSIMEIRQLMGASEQQIYEAFDRKIRQQAEKLERIKAIQQSYLAEKSIMEKAIQELSQFLTSQLTTPVLLQEFGIAPQDAPEAVARIRSYLEEQALSTLPEESNVTLTINEQVFQGEEAVADAIHSLNEDNLQDTIHIGDETVTQKPAFSADQYATLWECHGWQWVHEILASIPAMEEKGEYVFSFRLNADKYAEGIGFPMLMIGVMLPKVHSDGIDLGCSVDKSCDAQNYFALLYRKN